MLPILWNMPATWLPNHTLFTLSNAFLFTCQATTCSVLNHLQEGCGRHLGANTKHHTELRQISLSHLAGSMETLFPLPIAHEEMIACPQPQ